MATDTAKVLETLGKMTVLELVELKNAIEEEWGVTAAAPMAAAKAAAARTPVTRRNEWPMTPSTLGRRATAWASRVGIAIGSARSWATGAWTARRRPLDGPRRAAESHNKEPRSMTGAPRVVGVATD